MLKKIKYQRQINDYDCGPASVEMVLGYFGIRRSQNTLAKELGTTKRYGTSHVMLKKVFRSYGIRTTERRGSTLKEVALLLRKKNLVFINYVEPSADVGHYSLVISVTKSNVILDDPWNGKGFSVRTKEFLRRWKMRKCWMLYFENKIKPE